MKFPYEDILDTPYPFPGELPKISPADRAAQFSPFAALTGYEESIRESARRTNRRIELTEESQQEINSQLLLLRENPELVAAVTYFEPDLYKTGGAYHTVTGKW